MLSASCLSILAVDKLAHRFGCIIHLYLCYYNHKNCEELHPYVEKKSARILIRRKWPGASKQGRWTHEVK